MLNLYCYHSPISSSAGFQEAGWTISDGSCSVMDIVCASEEVRKLLRSGGFEVICMDTGRGTRAFIVRGITVRQNMQSGWKLNFAFETDRESGLLWKDLTAAFLNDRDGFTREFAALFSIHYENGEYYIMNAEGFLRLVHESAGSMDMLLKCAGAEVSPSSREIVRSIVQKLCVPYEDGKLRMLLLVPSVTLDYFMRCLPVKNLSVPEGCCIEKEVWEAILEHGKLPEGAAKSQHAESGFTARYGFPMCRLAILGGGLAAAAAAAVYWLWRMLGRRLQWRGR